MPTLSSIASYKAEAPGVASEERQVHCLLQSPYSAPTPIKCLLAVSLKKRGPTDSLGKFTALNMTDGIQAYRDDHDRECSYHIKRSPLISQRSTLPSVRVLMTVNSPPHPPSPWPRLSLPSLAGTNTLLSWAWCSVRVASRANIKKPGKVWLTPGVFLCSAFSTRVLRERCVIDTPCKKLAFEGFSGLGSCELWLETCVYVRI